MNNPTLSQAECRAVLAPLLAAHDWRLIEVEEFCQRVLQHHASAQEIGQDGILKSAVNVYCESWHAACRSNGERRQRAYTELAHYLYDRALHKYHDAEMAHEITHEAILLIAQQIDQVRNPGAFLAFALLKLWNAATTYFRQRDRQARRTQPLPDPSEEDQPSEVADQSTPLPAITSERSELERQVRARIEALIAEAPRAQLQFQAVLLKFLHGYSDSEIAEALATDVANVHVLRSRGLNRLRGDTALRQLFEDQ